MSLAENGLWDELEQRRDDQMSLAGENGFDASFFEPLGVSLQEPFSPASSSVSSSPFSSSSSSAAHTPLQQQQQQQHQHHYHHHQQQQQHLVDAPPIGVSVSPTNVFRFNNTTVSPVTPPPPVSANVSTFGSSDEERARSPVDINVASDQSDEPSAATCPSSIVSSERPENETLVEAVREGVIFSNEQLRSFSSKEFDQYIKALTKTHQVSAEELKLLKRQSRQIKNREYAVVSRRRRKQKKVAEQQNKSELAKENEQLRMSVLRLETQLNAMQELLHSVVGSSSSSPSLSASATSTNEPALPFYIDGTNEGSEKTSATRSRLANSFLSFNAKGTCLFVLLFSIAVIISPNSSSPSSIGVSLSGAGGVLFDAQHPSHAGLAPGGTGRVMLTLDDIQAPEPLFQRVASLSLRFVGKRWRRDEFTAHWRDASSGEAWSSSSGSSSLPTRGINNTLNPLETRVVLGGRRAVVSADSSSQQTCLDDNDESCLNVARL